MNEKQLKEYLSVDGVDNLIREHKLLTVLYVAFTILFIDLHFFVTSLYKVNETLVFSIMIMMTALIIPLVVFIIIGRKLSVFQLFLIQGLDFALISAIWFCVLLVKSQGDDILIDKWHIVTVSIIMIISLSAVFFRVYKLRNYTPSKKKDILHVGLFTIAIGITIILRRILSNLGEEMTNIILGHGLIILCGSFLTLSSMAFLNAIIVKKYRFTISSNC